MCIYKDEQLVYKRVKLEYKFNSGMILRGKKNKHEMSTLVVPC